MNELAMIEQIEIGDIVATPQGVLGGVTWVKGEEVGMMFLPSEKDYWPGGMVYSIHEVILVRKEASLMGSLFSNKWNRGDMIGEREARKVLPTEPERKKREVSRMDEL